jgi:predicted phage-related endonuclease
MTLSAEDHAARRKFVGASEVPTILGLSYYTRSTLEVWRAKCDPTWEPSEQTEAQALGHEFEAVLLRVAARRAGGELISERQVPIRHARYDVGATLDARMTVAGEWEPVEAKLVGPHLWDRWGEEGDGADGVPEGILVQVQAQLSVVQRPRARVVAACGTDVRTYVVPYHEALAEGACRGAQSWWDSYVVPRTPPPTDGSESCGQAVRAMFPRSREAALVANDEDEILAAFFLDAQEREKAAKLAKEQAAQKLQMRIGEAALLKGTGWAATWRTNKTAGVAWKDAAEEMLDLANANGLGPRFVGIPDRHRGEPSRPFSLKRKP